MWSNSTEMSNVSDNVMRKNCFGNFDTLACIRGAVLTFLFALTALICAARILRLHCSRDTKYHQYALFYLAVAQCSLGTFEFVSGWCGQSSVVSMYIRCMELLVLAHFYISILLRIFHFPDKVQRRSLVPALFFFLGYFTAVLVLAMNGFVDPTVDCYAYFFLLMASGEVFIVELICVTCILICYRLNHMLADTDMRTTQQKDLIILVFALEMSAVANISYHTSLHFLANGVSGCSEIFGHRQVVYSSVKLPFELFSFVLPIWAILWVFRGDSTQSDEDDGTAETEGVTGSDNPIRDAALHPVYIRGMRQVRNQRRLPSPYLSGYRPLGPTPASLRRVNSTGVILRRGPLLTVLRRPNVRTVQSQKQKPPKQLRKTLSVPNQIPVTRHLSTIPEESSSTTTPSTTPPITSTPTPDQTQSYDERGDPIPGRYPEESVVRTH